MATLLDNRDQAKVQARKNGGNAKFELGLSSFKNLTQAQAWSS